MYGDLLPRVTDSTSALAKLMIQLVEKDQLLRKEGVGTGSEQDLELRRKLDSIIAAQGWPSTFQVKTRGSGVSLILAHQGNLSRDDFEHYYRLAAQKCLQLEERWGVALFILEQRYQWLGSNLRVYNEKPDTLELWEGDAAAIEPQFALPYITAMSKTLGSNSTKKLRLILKDQTLADEIKALIYAFEHQVDMPEEVLKMLIAQGYDHPAPLSDERLLFEIDPKMAPNKLAYAFFK